jgi:hypothetical protein
MDELQLMAADFIQMMHNKGYPLPETEEFFDAFTEVLWEFVK